jgi:hypothetical protein
VVWYVAGVVWDGMWYGMWPVWYGMVCGMAYVHHILKRYNNDLINSVTPNWL